MSMLGFGKTADSIMDGLRRLTRRHFLLYGTDEAREAAVRSGAVLPDASSCCIMEYGNW